MILHLGVVDVPYANPPRIGRGRRPRKTAAGSQTTGDVAGFLENRYHVMEIFAGVAGNDIVAAVENSMQGAVESLLMGAPISQPLNAATAAIEDRFKKFLSDKEMERLGYPGVPTQAALKGVSHRFKKPYAKRAARPSFVDTGLLMASFKAWTD